MKYGEYNLFFFNFQMAEHDYKNYKKILKQRYYEERPPSVAPPTPAPSSHSDSPQSQDSMAVVITSQASPPGPPTSPSNIKQEDSGVGSQVGILYLLFITSYKLIRKSYFSLQGGPSELCI